MKPKQLYFTLQNQTNPDLVDSYVFLQAKPMQRQHNEQLEITTAID